MKKRHTVHIIKILFFIYMSLLIDVPIKDEIVSVVHAKPVRYSDLWGMDGEEWDSNSRLPDFSFAGYHSGEQQIPDRTATTNIKDFGAKGDGDTNDTEAFQAAIAATNNGVIFIPAGQYNINDILEINKPNIVLRGAGQNKTTLVFRNSLERLLGEAPYGGQAMIGFYGENLGQRITTVVEPALRGDSTLRVSSAAGIQAGQMIRLKMTNPQSNSLGCYVYADQGCLNEQRQAWHDRRIVDWVVEVKAVEGSTLQLTRPLRLDVIKQWQPEIWEHRPTVEEVGLEDLTIEFPNQQYAGHHKESGYYAVIFDTAFNCWMRRVTVTDADIGVEINGGGYNTVTEVTLKTRWRKLAQNPNVNATGHYGILIRSLAQDNLVEKSELLTRFVHNMSLNSFANGNVYSAIKSDSGRFDHHGAAPYENLFTDIVLIKTASDLLKSGGNRADEPNAGARTTLWNITSVRSKFPSNFNNRKFPQINMIGINQGSTKHTSDREWIENWPGALTEPPNLYEAQLRRRLNAKSSNTVSSSTAGSSSCSVSHADGSTLTFDPDGVSHKLPSGFHQSIVKVSISGNAQMDAYEWYDSSDPFAAYTQTTAGLSGQIKKIECREF